MTFTAKYFRLLDPSKTGPAILMNGARTLLVVSLLMLSLANVIMSSATSVGPSTATGIYRPGVRVGDWWKISIGGDCVFLCPAGVQFSNGIVNRSVNSTIIDVKGNNVTLENTVYVTTVTLAGPVTTITTTNQTQNVETGQPGIPYYLLATNLTAEDRVYNNLTSPVIANVQPMELLGATRNVTESAVGGSYNGTSYLVFLEWDQLTGILASAQFQFSMGRILGIASMTLTATNIWEPVPDFTLNLFPGDLIMPSNGTRYLVDILIDSLYGFSGNVSLTAVSNSTLFLADLHSNVVKLVSGSHVDSNMTVSSKTVGAYNVNVTATSGSLACSTMLHATVLPATVGSFAISSSLHSLTILPGNATTINVSVTSIDNFTGPVTLTLAAFNDATGVNVINDPFGAIRVWFDTSQVSLGANETSTDVLHVEAANFPGVHGNFTVEIDAVGGVPEYDHDLNMTVSVLSPDFILRNNPSMLSIPTGGSANSTITVRGYGLFGTINLTTSISPSGAECVVSPTDLSLVAGPVSEGNSTLTCHGSPGTYTVVITAASGSLQHSTNVTLTVEGSAPKPSTSSGFSLFGLPTVESYGVISAIVAVVLALAGTGVYLLRRKPAVR
jgi:hypothetical protein